MHIRLLTATREFVHEAQIPPFHTLPAVIFWGVRPFRLDMAGETIAVYIECWVYMLPIEQETNP